MAETPKKKIIIDEDWKSQVEAEREELARKQKEMADQPPGQAADEMSMPPASFEMLLTTLASEAMVCLGQVPHPATGKATVNLDQAKYFIDTLAILMTKTEGNLSAEEAQALETILHQLRMVYVAIDSDPGAPETV